MSTNDAPESAVSPAVERVTEQPFAMPDRIAIDAKGYGWRVWNDDSLGWSMVPVNPDNSPIPMPVTWFVPASGVDELDELRAYVRAVDRWLAESDEARNEGGNPHVHVIAPLDSAERVVGIARHMLGQKFPHLNDGGN